MREKEKKIEWKHRERQERIKGREVRGKKEEAKR